MYVITVGFVQWNGERSGNFSDRNERNNQRNMLNKHTFLPPQTDILINCTTWLMSVRYNKSKQQDGHPCSQGKDFFVFSLIFFSPSE